MLLLLNYRLLFNLSVAAFHLCAITVLARPAYPGHVLIPFTRIARIDVVSAVSESAGRLTVSGSVVAVNCSRLLHSIAGCSIAIAITLKSD